MPPAAPVREAKQLVRWARRTFHRLPIAPRRQRARSGLSNSAFFNNRQRPTTASSPARTGKAIGLQDLRQRRSARTVSVDLERGEGNRRRSAANHSRSAAFRCARRSKTRQNAAFGSARSAFWAAATATVSNRWGGAPGETSSHWNKVADLHRLKRRGPGVRRQGSPHGRPAGPARSNNRRARFPRREET